jgi:hypothetical protein
VLVFALPSTLNLPQTNPTETAEFAPVPPSDDAPPPADAGNVSSFGLAGTETLKGSVTTTIPPPPDESGPPPPAPSNLAVSRSPSAKRCVGSPPRQTEDPLAPPCAAYFDPDADNGGATYLGVTKDEVRVLWYIDGGGDYESSQGFEPAPMATYQDLGQPPDPNGEFVYTRAIRGWQRYFNERFQTYGRFVHFYIYWTDADHSPEARRAEAADNFAKIKPFAVLSEARDNADAYLEAMAQRGVMNFGSTVGRDESFFRKFPRLAWGYPPSVQVAARSFAAYVCKKVVPYRVSFAGSAEMNGQPRRLGLLSTTDPARPGYVTYAREVKRMVEECGGHFVDARTFPSAGSENDANNTPDVAAQNIASFRQNGVTTIVWAQGEETTHTKAAQSAGYLPEWVVGGDHVLEGNGNSSFQGRQAWDHAVVVTDVTNLEAPTEQQCYLAYKEADPDAVDSPDVTLHACNLYRNPFQLFVGIQVSGPRLRPETIDQGFRAIPKIASTNPHVPACFYEIGDYTCVKDAQVEWWDSSGTTDGSRAGCWRMMEGGRRYFADRWPDGDVMAQRAPGDPCNNYYGDIHL